MKTEEKITKISSKYILKEIFSYIDYNRALKLVKYNNNLKEKIDVGNEDYSLTIKYSIGKVKESLPLAPNKKQNFVRRLLFLIILVILIFIYIDSIKVIENSEEKKGKESEKENIYAFFLLLSAFIFWFSFFIILCSNCGFNKFWFKIMLALNILNIIAMIVPILKLNFDVNASYQINKIVFICDKALIILFPILIIIYSLYIYKYYEIIRGYHFVNKIIITEFRKFKINEIFFDTDFNSKNIEEQRKIIKDCCFNYSLSQQQKELINLINNFREKNNCDLLKYNEDENINDYFKEVKPKRLYNYETIISLDTNKSLFTFPINEFKNHFLKNDKDILNILKNGLLNQILILEKGNKEYILVYHSKQNNTEPILYVGIRVNENPETSNNLLKN